MPPGFGTIWLAVAIDLVGFGIVFPILPVYARRFGASSATAAGLVAAFAAASFVFSPLWGRMSDRFGRKPLLLLSLAGTCVGSLITGLAGGIALLYVGRVVDGISGASVSVAQASVSDVAKPEQRARLFGLLGAAFGLGFVAGPAIGALAALFGPRVPFYVAAALAGINALVAIRRLPETHPRGAGVAELTGVDVTVAAVQAATVSGSAPIDADAGVAGVVGARPAAERLDVDAGAVGVVGARPPAEPSDVDAAAPGLVGARLAAEPSDVVGPVPGLVGARLAAGPSDVDAGMVGLVEARPTAGPSDVDAGAVGVVGAAVQAPAGPGPELVGVVAGGPGSGGDGGGRARAGPSRNPIRALAGGRGVGMFVAVAFGALLAFSAFEATFALFGQKRLGFGIGSSAAVFAVIGLAIVGVQGGLVHAVVSRIGEVSTLRLGLLIDGVGLLGLAFVRSWPELAPALLALTVGQGLVQTTMSSTLAGRADPARRGEVLGAQQSAGGLARVIGPLLGGILFQRVGPGAPYVVGAAVMLGVLVLFQVADASWASGG